MSAVLLDTHAWVWSFADDDLLSEVAREAIGQAQAVYVSPISFFEIGQIFLRYALLFAIGGIDWIIYGLILSFVYSQFITLRCLWNNRINSLN